MSVDLSVQGFALGKPSLVLLREECEQAMPTIVAWPVELSTLEATELPQTKNIGFHHIV